MTALLRRTASLGLTIAIAGCGTPRTDIVATTTEDVGEFHVQSSDSGGQLVGQVCIEKRQHADEIVGRIIQQLANHHYRSITLDVFSKEQPLGRYVWTPGGLQQSTSTSTPNPCDARARS